MGESLYRAADLEYTLQMTSGTPIANSFGGASGEAMPCEKMLCGQDENHPCITNTRMSVDLIVRLHAKQDGQLWPDQIQIYFEQGATRENWTCPVNRNEYGMFMGGINFLGNCLSNHGESFKPGIVQINADFHYPFFQTDSILGSLKLPPNNRVFHPAYILLTKTSGGVDRRTRCDDLYNHNFQGINLAPR